jgi:PAS domain-containing protein
MLSYNAPFFMFLHYSFFVRLRVFENRVLRRIFGSKRDEMTGGWRIIRMIMSRRMRWAWHVAQLGEKRNAYRIWVEKPEGTRPVGRPRHTLFINIKRVLER